MVHKPYHHVFAPPTSIKFTLLLLDAVCDFQNYCMISKTVRGIVTTIYNLLKIQFVAGCLTIMWLFYLQYTNTHVNFKNVWYDLCRTNQAYLWTNRQVSLFRVNLLLTEVDREDIVWLSAEDPASIYAMEEWCCSVFLYIMLEEYQSSIAVQTASW